MRSIVVEWYAYAVALLPKWLRLAVRRSPLRHVTKAFTQGAPDGLYRIRRGPLRGRVIDVEIDSYERSYLTNSHEPEVIAALGQYCEVGMTAMDIGAHNGYFSMFLALQAGAGGICVAVEPVAGNAARIRRALVANGISNVLVEQLACGSEERQGMMCLDDSSMIGRLASASLRWASDEDACMEAVTVTTVDAIVSRLGLSHVDILKIDVEGAELSVLEGAATVLRESGPTLFIETHQWLESAPPLDALLSFLRQFAYQVVDLKTRETIESGSGGSPPSYIIATRSLTRIAAS